MFFFKKKDKKKVHETICQDKILQKKDLLEIKLPDDFSTIVLPQLIDYEYEKNNNDTIINTTYTKDQNRISREGWLPATRLNNDHIQGTLLDTTNITASSLVQCKPNRRSSISLSSSSYGDTITCHSKDGSVLEQDYFETDDIKLGKTIMIERNLVPNLRISRPSFKRRYPRFTILCTDQKNDNILKTETVNSSSSSTSSSLEEETEEEEKVNEPLTPIIQSEQSIIIESTSHLQPKLYSSSVNYEIGMIEIPQKNNNNKINPDHNVVNNNNNITLKNNTSIKKKLVDKKINQLTENNHNNPSMIPRRPKSTIFESNNKDPINHKPNDKNKMKKMKSSPKLNSKIPIRNSQVKKPLL